jgi:RNA polymerase sigma factor (sigma-70 family)
VGYTPPSAQTTSAGGGWFETRSDVTDDPLFLSNLPLIDEVVGQVCRRHRLSANEAEDFASDVHLHFIDRNYERLRRFEGRSTLKTYITVCVQRCFLDYRNKVWGKWRPSAEATRTGPEAVLLERMVVRDGWTIEQAGEVLKTQYGIVADERLAALSARLAHRQPPRERVSDEEADRIESPAPAPDAHIVRAEHDFLAKRLRAACARACASLRPEERLILRMKFDDMPVADIARALHLNQKRLYRTIELLLTALRTTLEAEGFAHEEIRALLASGALAETDARPHVAAAAGVKASGAIKRTSWLQRR